MGAFTFLHCFNVTVSVRHWRIWAESPFDFLPLSWYTQKASTLTMKYCVQPQWGSGFQAARTCLSVVIVQSRLLFVYSSAASAGKSLLKVVFGGLENVLDIVAVHPKWNTTSIKQTRRTQPIHQRAAWISYWVQLRRDKCRTSSVCPRLPIDRDHHCDVAFYLATCSLKLYIILFPTRRSHRRTGKGLRKGTALIVSFILSLYCYHLFKLFSQH